MMLMMNFLTDFLAMQVTFSATKLFHREGAIIENFLIKLHALCNLSNSYVIHLLVSLAILFSNVYFAFCQSFIKVYCIVLYCTVPLIVCS